MTDILPPRSRDHTSLQQALGLALLFALLKFAIHLGTNLWQAHLGWGYFSDESYYILCGQRLDWGYVDHGPIVALQARLAVALFGKSLAGIRMFASLAGAIKVGLTGLLAWQLGGKKAAQCLAMVGALLCPEFLAVDSFLSMNVCEPVFWMIAGMAIVEVIKTGNEKWWLVFGFAAGIGCENKPSMVFFLAAILISVACTSTRRILNTRGFLIGIAVGFLLVLPNLIWQAHHHWATLEFLRVSNASRHLYSFSVVRFLGIQAAMMGGLSLPVLGFGLVWLLRNSDSVPFRFLGYAFVLFFFAMLIMHAKEYYLTPIYPILFAAGGVAGESFAASRQWRRLIPAYLLLLVPLELLGSPTSLPILRPQQWLNFAADMHLRSRAVEKKCPFPAFFALRFGWQELADQVTRIYESLPPADQARAGIFCADYNMASAINFEGAGRGLPRAISGHNNYYLWGPEGESGEVMIVVTSKTRNQLLEEYGTAQQVDTMYHPYGLGWHTNIFLCRNRKVPFTTDWARMKDYF